MNKIAKDYISENNSEFTVHGESGKKMGTYPTREAAEKRLKHIEHFKQATDAADMSPDEMESLRGLIDKFFSEEAKEPEHQEADAPKIGGGLVLMAPTGNVLLLLRAASEKNYGGHWGLPGGKADDGETPEEAAARETFEETGYRPVGDLQKLNTVVTPNGFIFTTFLQRCDGEFEATLSDGEHDDWKWISPSALPENTHPGVVETLMGIANAGALDSIVFDKDTVRTVDDAGRMHVASAHISKATVNPYYGREIPFFEQMGLDPERVYQMFRDPVELKKAASTFNGVQILIRHIQVSADQPQKDEIVGTTGTSAEFEDPYLNNELIIWSQDGINAIESGNQRELSCGYAYTPVMEPGFFNGERYDGRMTEIKGNHVALVSKGRAGPDVVVGDEAIKLKETDMKPLTKTAARVQAALSAYLAPKIALDSQLKLSTALASGLINIDRAAIGKKNFKLAIVKMAKDAAEPMLTPEAKKSGGIGPDDVIMRVLDMVEGQVAADPTDPGEADEGGGGEATNEWRKNVMDAMMKAGMDEKAASAICDMFPADAEPKAEGEDDAEEIGEDDTPEEKEDMEKKEKKAGEAMDAAITKATKLAEDNTMKRLNDIRIAERAVAPLIGEVSVAMDSAEEIYRTALKANDIKIDGVDPSAFPAMINMLVKQKATTSTVHKIAQDSFATGDERAAFEKANGIESRKVRHLGA